MKPGTVLFAEGDRAEAAYVVMQGSIDLVRARGRTPMPLGRRSVGEIVGESALVADHAHTETAVTAETSEVLVMTRDQLSRRLGTVDPLLRLWLGALFERTHGAAPWAEHVAEASTLLASEHDLRRAIERDEFVLRFQPIVHLPTRRLAGFETLLRWEHPTQGLLLPERFIPLAEATGLISAITTAVLRGVVREFPVLAAAALPSDPPLFLTINVSGADLRRADFAATAISILVDGGVDPRAIRLEITESVFITDPETSTRTLQQCRDQGMRIAIDDFGTGYSSLNYLYALPVSTLKMDRSFAKSLLSDPVGRKVIGAILHLGGELNLDVVAEGIEEESEAAMLTGMGCGYGQGYLFGRPAPLQTAVDLIGAWNHQPASAPKHAWG